MMGANPTLEHYQHMFNPMSSQLLDSILRTRIYIMYIEQEKYNIARAMYTSSLTSV